MSDPTPPSLADAARAVLAAYDALVAGQPIPGYGAIDALRAALERHDAAPAATGAEAMREACASVCFAAAAKATEMARRARGTDAFDAVDAERIAALSLYDEIRALPLPAPRAEAETVAVPRAEYEAMRDVLDAVVAWVKQWDAADAMKSWRLARDLVAAAEKYAALRGAADDKKGGPRA